MTWNEHEQIAFITSARSTEDDEPLDDHIKPWGIWGREKISHLYEYHVAFTFGKERKPLSAKDIDALLKAPAALALGGEEGDNVVHGVLESVERTDTGIGGGGYSYLAKLVPSAWLLTLARTNRVFLGKTIHAVIAEVLSGYGLKRANKPDDPGYYEIRATEQAARDYVVQYEENDWDFIQRWLEREGLFYWFEQRAKGERLVIAEKNPGIPDERSEMRYDNHTPPLPHSIAHWHVRHRRVPARVALLDYNYRTPAAFIKGKADVDAEMGFGTVFSYGEHFKDDAEGARLAGLRAEALRLEGVTITGTVNFPRLRAGYGFSLKNHEDEGDYVVTSIEHQVGVKIHVTGKTPWERERVTAGSEDVEIDKPRAAVEVDGAQMLRAPAPQAKPADASAKYAASFEAIAHDVPFRPERVTPWPRIAGVLNAHIEEDTDGKYAQIDDQGRYKVKLPFDLSGRTGTKASHWVRMAEPYSGDAYGAHFPLHKGAEVLLAHVAGDPDRPIIAAAAPNPLTKSPVTDQNSTQSVIRTASGIHIEMEDLEA